MSDYIPIEKPGKSFTFSSSHGVGKDSSKGEKKEKRGWSFGVSPKPEEDLNRRNKYMKNLSNIKDEASGISNKYKDSVVKAWTFNSVRGDSKAPELNRYGDSLSKLKGRVDKNKK